MILFTYHLQNKWRIRYSFDFFNRCFNFFSMILSRWISFNCSFLLLSSVISLFCSVFWLINSPVAPVVTFFLQFLSSMLLSPSFSIYPFHISVSFFLYLDPSSTNFLLLVVFFCRSFRRIVSLIAMPHRKISFDTSSIFLFFRPLSFLLLILIPRR